MDIGLAPPSARRELPGAWLRPKDQPAPTRYWLACLPKEKIALAMFVATVKVRWHVEQDYRRLKNELELDHCEG